VRVVEASAGELVVVTMLSPGSPASAHLQFILVSQAGNASLPEQGELEGELRDAGFTRTETTRLVPGEPFVGLRAR
jgi:hypothetical protein